MNYTDKNTVFVFPFQSVPTVEKRKAQRQQAENKIKEILATRGLRAEIDRLPCGKITCSDNVFVSVAHSGNLIAVAVANREIGVDVQMQTNVNSNAIVEKFFTKRERQAFADAENFDDTFFTVWCRKEALWKSLKNQPKTIQTVETCDEKFTETTLTVDGEKYFLAVTGDAEIITEKI